MSGRVPLADDAAAIARRLREIRAERAAAIAGCAPAAPESATQKMAIEALRRAGARVRRTAAADPPDTADDIIERAIAAKLARHRVLS